MQPDDVKRCPGCGAGDMETRQESLRVMLDGVEYTMAQAVTACASCGESFVAGEEVKRTERALVQAVAEGASGPQALRHLRRWLGWSGVKLGELLGVTEVTVSRWENGHRGVDGNAFALVARVALEALEGGEGTRRWLERRAERAKGERAEVVELA